MKYDNRQSSRDPVVLSQLISELKTNAVTAEHTVLIRRLVDRKSYYLHRDKRLAQKKEYSSRSDVQRRRSAYVRKPENKARRRLRQNRDYASNPEKKKAQVYAYRKRNPEANAAAAKKWREANPEKVRAAMHAWYVKNRSKAQEGSRRYKLHRRKIDPAFRLLGNLRRRLNIAVRAKRNTKSDATMPLTGCSPSELVAHLESKFSPGMTWANYGLHGWHVDHKKPCAAFDLSDTAQQRACFHYTNLQPLWYEDNHRKHDHFE